MVLEEDFLGWIFLEVFDGLIIVESNYFLGWQARVPFFPPTFSSFTSFKRSF